MSSKARKIENHIVSRKIVTVAQLLYILENEAKKKSFFARLKIALKYLFFKKFDTFYQ